MDKAGAGETGETGRVGRKGEKMGADPREDRTISFGDVVSTWGGRES